jgi:diguanylate cyclase (GGDEF)-like protein/PAS domain S-box-containing protein
VLRFTIIVSTMAIRRIAVVLLLFRAAVGLALEPGKRLEQYVRIAWTADRGLPQSTVFAVTQTRDRYIWVATQEGFVRFDGSKFTTYDKTSYPQIISNFALSMRAARDGSLYVGTMGGGLIHLRGEQVDVMTNTEGLPNDDVAALHESSDGTLWIGTRLGLARLSNGRITPFAANDQLPHQSITGLAEDSSGRLWIGTGGGLATYKDDKVSVYSAGEGFPRQAISALRAGRDGSLWIGTDGEGLFRYRSEKVQKYGRAEGVVSSRISAVYEDRNGTIWIGTYDRGFGRLRDNQAEFDSDTKDAVSTIFEDREGNLWIGRVGGLTRLADGAVVAFAKAEGLSDDDVKTVAGDRNGTIWVGTRQGLETLNGSRRFSERNGLSSSRVLSTWVGRDGSLWIGTGDAGLNRVQGTRVTTYTTKDGLPGDLVGVLFEDRHGVIWAGTSGGLARDVDGKVIPYALPRSLAGESISAIYESRDGALWIGTHVRGVHRIAGGSVDSFTVRNGLSTNFVLSVYEDSAGTMWIGTAGGGLNRYKDGKFSAITPRQGLHDDSVFAILEDAAANLWMSCNKGIFHASLSDLNAAADRRSKVRSVVYGISDGMRSRECNAGTQPVAWKTPDGKLWFATTGGVAMIDPQKAVLGAAVAPVLVEGIYADRSTRIAPGGKVPPGHHTLEFHYTSPTFRTPDKLRFQYKLEGFDEEWRDADTRRVAYYTNVPPGRYQFHVRATNGEGATSPHSTVAVSVQPFFYQTPFFWAIIAAAIVTAAWTAHRWRIGLIRASAERFKLLFDRNLAGVYRATIDGRILDCNQACLTILGFSALAELNDRRIFDSYTTPSDGEELIQRVRQDGAVSGVETSLRRPDGTPVWVLQNVSLAAAPQGKEILEATLVDITDRKLAEEQIRYQAYHDALTDLPNRALFKDRLGLAVAHAERRGSQVAVLFLDLDRFKLINDTLGHTVGDHLLQGMADRLKSCVREEDSVARVGGDEFTILLMDLRRPADAMIVARKILDVVQRPITIDGHELYVTCSIGISMSPADGEDAETLLKNADNALYRAKEAGKNQYQLCTPSMTRLAAERLALESALRQAIDRNEFLVLYQPQYDMRLRRIVGVEALVRWDRPGKGIVRPAEFIAAAEESRLIVPIGELVLQAAAQQAKIWDEKFAVRVAVNVSAAQFQQRQLVRTIRDALQYWALEPSRLEVEITESTAMQNPDVTADILRELKDLGVTIVIDDFGIGHSSLNYLKRFPIDGLKIDRTFVQDMITNESDAGIVSAIIAMASALKLRVTAEGVETEEQLAFLESHACASFQGYLLSRPLPAQAMTEMLQSEISSPVLAP